MQQTVQCDVALHAARRRAACSAASVFNVVFDFALASLWQPGAPVVTATAIWTATARNGKEWHLLLISIRKSFKSERVFAYAGQKVKATSKTDAALHAARRAARRREKQIGREFCCTSKTQVTAADGSLHIETAHPNCKCNRPLTCGKPCDEDAAAAANRCWVVVVVERGDSPNVA